MDIKTIVGWIVPVVIRGLSWIFAAKLGLDAAVSKDLATSGAEAIGALVLVGWSVYTSVKERKALLMQDPPA